VFAKNSPLRGLNFVRTVLSALNCKLVRFSLRDFHLLSFFHGKKPQA
jgi:hypothetical protein